RERHEGPGEACGGGEQSIGYRRSQQGHGAGEGNPEGIEETCVPTGTARESRGARRTAGPGVGCGHAHAGGFEEFGGVSREPPGLREVAGPHVEERKVQEGPREEGSESGRSAGREPGRRRPEAVQDGAISRRQRTERTTNQPERGSP